MAFHAGAGTVFLIVLAVIATVVVFAACAAEMELVKGVVSGLPLGPFDTALVSWSGFGVAIVAPMVFAANSSVLIGELRKQARRRRRRAAGAARRAPDRSP